MKTLAISMLCAACGSGMSGGDDSAVTDAGAGPGSGSGSGQGSGSASESAWLYPLTVGNAWTYTVTAVGAGSICAPGTREQHVVSANMAGGRAAFQMTNFCTAIAGTYDYAAGANDEVDFYYQMTWSKLLDPMLSEGHMWPYFNTSYHWHRETHVTVPAGTYDDCWSAVQDVSYSASLTYCRGVGLVRSYSSDLDGSGWDAELASVTIH